MFTRSPISLQYCCAAGGLSFLLALSGCGSDSSSDEGLAGSAVWGGSGGQAGPARTGVSASTGGAPAAGQQETTGGTATIGGGAGGTTSTLVKEGSGGTQTKSASARGGADGEATTARGGASGTTGTTPLSGGSGGTKTTKSASAGGGAGGEDVTARGGTVGTTSTLIKGGSGGGSSGGIQTTKSASGGAGGKAGSGTVGQDDPVCDLPDAVEFQANTSIGPGGSSYKASDHFIVFGASNPDPVLKLLESAHQCFVEDWCWRSTGLSIVSDSGKYYKTNVYSKASMAAGGYMQYDARAGLSYLEVLASQIALPQVTVHEYGHALTLAAKGWVDQKNTGFWWESVANFVADTFITSSYCENARKSFGIEAGESIIELDKVYGQSYTVICNSQNYYQAWPFLTYITNNPDNYSGLGRMVLPDMFRLHQGNNETPLHVLERIAKPVTAQTILGRYWARMAYLDIGHPQAQKAFLSKRSRLNFAANLDSAGDQTYRVKANRKPQYGGANINPLGVSGNGDVSVQVTNSGNGLQESNFTATLAIRSNDGSVRYVDLPDGSGQATVGSNEEASLVVVNTPDKLYMYDPQYVGSPENVGLNYQVKIAGATPTN